MNDKLLLDYTKINHRLLSRKEEQEAFAKYHAGDKDAFELLVTSQIPLAIKIATSFAKHDMGMRDEFIQEAQYSLCYAVTKFDPSKGFRLSTYISRCVMTHLLNYRVEKKLIRIPRNAHAKKNKDKWLLTKAYCVTDSDALPEIGYETKDSESQELNLDFSTLSKREIQVMRGLYILDLKPKQIAKHLGIPSNYVHAAKTIALKKLRKIYLTRPESMV